MLPCPTPTELTHCANGDLPEREAASILEHVEQCPLCMTSIDTMLRSNDALFKPGLPPDQAASDAAAEAGEDETGCPLIFGYRMIQRCGKRGGGVVYHARHMRTNREVAIKIIDPGPATTPEQAVRFRAVAERITVADHPNLVALREVGDWQGQPYLALEWLDAPSLAKQLRQAVLAPADAARLVARLADALHVAHLHGLFHRDLKPAHILLSGDRPKVADLGLAGLLGSPGTPEYLAPEQLTGPAHGLGASVDVYSLGVILFESLTGHPPFSGATAYAVTQKVLQEPPPAPRNARPDVPDDLELICLKCLEKEPGKRYASARELAEDLNRFLRGEPIAARQQTEMDRVRRWARRRPAVVALVAALCLGLLAAIAAGCYLALDAQRGEAAARQEKEAAAAAAEAERQHHRLERRALAELLLDRGVLRAEQGDVAEGLLWLASALRHADGALAERVERLIDTWLAQFPAIEQWLPITPESAALSPDGRTLAAIDRTTGEARITFWDWRTGQPLGDPLATGYANCAAPLFSPDGGLLLTISGAHPDYRGQPGWARVWDVRTRQPRSERLIHNGPALAAHWEPTGQVFQSTDDSKAYRWTLGKDRPEILPASPVPPPDIGLRHQLHRADGLQIRRVPDQPTVTRPVQDSPWPIAALVDPATQTVSGVPLLGITTRYQARAGGSAAAVVTTEEPFLVRTWDAATGEQSGKLLRLSAAPSALAVSPNQKFVAFNAAANTVEIRHVGSGELACPPLPVGAAPTALAFPDDRTLAVATADGAIQRWDIASGGRTGAALHLPSAARPPSCLAFSPKEDSMLLLGYPDGTAQLRLVDDMRPYAARVTQPAPVADAALAGSLRTTSPDGLVRTWRLRRPAGTPADEVERLIQSATALRLDGTRGVVPLTRAEWQKLPRVAAPEPLAEADWNRAQAIAAMQAGAWAPARWYLARLLAADDKNWLTHALLAHASIRAGRTADADTSLQTARTLAPARDFDSWLRSQAAVCLVTDPTAARWFLNHLAKAHPDDADVLLHLARLNKDDKELTRALALGVDSVTLWQLVSESLRAGKWDEADARLKLLKPGRFDELTLAEAKALVCLRRNDSAAYKSLCGAVHLPQGNAFSDVVALCRWIDVVTLGPGGSEDAAALLTTLAARAKEAPAALRPTLLAARGALLYRTGKTTEARAALLEAAEGNAEPPTLVFLALCEHGAKNPDAAKRWLERARKTPATGIVALRTHYLLDEADRAARQ